MAAHGATGEQAVNAVAVGELLRGLASLAENLEFSAQRLSHKDKVL